MPNTFSKELLEIKKEVKKFHPNPDFALIEEAFYFSKNAHKTQKRKSGDPYFIHPLSIAKKMAKDGLGEIIISAALLHDVIEDTKTTEKEIIALFGKRIYNLVNGVTKLDKISFNSRQEHSTATIIKTILAASKDIRVLIIKLYDKLHNMQTIKFLSKNKQHQIASDVLTIYVPLAHKLNMHSLKIELENLAFSIINPKNYKKLKKEIKKLQIKKAIEIKETIKEIKNNFPKEKLEFKEVTKSIYSYHTKMIAQNKQLSELNDTLILIVLVENYFECYEIMGKIHSIFTPIPFKIKDFIAIPENGLYKSLHTQIIGPFKKPIKIYIETKEMHEIGKKGIVFKLRKNGHTITKISKEFSKIKKPAIKNQKELADSMNLNFYNKTMIVFSTEGKIVDLPQNSTVLDYSFFTEEKLANRTARAKVNGKIVPIWTKLNTGDRIKIIHSQYSNLNSGWLCFTKSSKVQKIIKNKLSLTNNKKENKDLIKIKIDAVDKPKLLLKQIALLSKNNLDMETTICKMYNDNTTCYTEFFIRDKGIKNLQKVIKKLKQLPETLKVTVNYFK